MSTVVVEAPYPEGRDIPRPENPPTKWQCRPKDAVMMFAWSIEDDEVTHEHPRQVHEECPPETYIG